MKKIIYLFFLFFAIIPQGWGAQSYTCSSSAPVRINQIYNPQSGGQIGYIELYVDQGPIDMRNWKICYSDNNGREKCIDIGNGNGDLYLNGVITGTDNPASSIPDNAFLVYPENIFNTGQGQPENTFSQNQGEALLLNGSGQAVHYLRYNTTSTYQNPEWSTGAGCTTDYTNISASNYGICATPDFSLPITQWSYNCADTKGNYNTTPTPTYCTALSYDLYHRNDTLLTPANRLHTQIAQNVFNVNASIACSGTGAIPARKIKNIYAITGTCPASTAGQSVVWSGSADLNATQTTVTLTGLNSTKAYSSIKLMLETDAGEFNCSSDTLAIRPSSFSFSSLLSPQKAADFNLTISAINSGNGYNGNAAMTTALQTANPNCPVANGFVKSSTGGSEPILLTFANDVKTSAMKATDVGDVVFNVKDTSWSLVDQPNDCVVNSNSAVGDLYGRFGCNIENNLSLRIVPDHFDINGTLRNSNSGPFTYLSTDLNMSASLTLGISAKNSEGNTTRNYDKGCYAKSTTLTLPHSLVPSPLTSILYNESLSGLNGTITKANDITLPLPSTVFTQGSAPLVLSLNFDRSRSQPLNPFDFTLTNEALTDTDGVTGSSIPAGTATYAYGRARAYDIKTDQNSIPNPVELEVYSTASSGYVSGMPQNILRWYRNLNHTSAAFGAILSGDDYPTTTQTGVSSTITITTSAIPANGLHPVQINNNDAISHATIHLAIPTWLWYSATNNYDFSANTKCIQHPCFDYQFVGTTSVSGVSSGTFGGSDFTIDSAKTTIKKGVKVFR